VEIILAQKKIYTLSLDIQDALPLPKKIPLQTFRS